MQGIIAKIGLFVGFGLAASNLPAALSPVPSQELRIAPNFQITQFSDPDLATDIFAMTLDSQGRVVVTGPGYIRRLEDTDGDGKADKVTQLAQTRTGGMGLCFDGEDLAFVGDGAFSVFREANKDGVFDLEPQKIVALHNAEHGAHAVRKGPDGAWYLIGGNDSGFNASYAQLPQSPIRGPEAGCLLRFAPDFSRSEIVADGLRNPYDFDFNAAGDLFTYDSDVERDFFLPCYTPTRIYHIGVGGHHSWRLNGWTRSWNRPDYYPDAVNILLRIGRGSPTGVVCYRHQQFPPHYQNGLFVLDWTFGRIWFVPLRPSGSTYLPAQPELFLEPVGSQGFAPTDATVAPDGSLFVSIGGRKTRGAVYRIQYVGPKTYQPPVKETPVQAVLNAPQPLEAWSRAKWVPTARKLGAAALADAAQNAALAPAQRLRAIEILTELFGGLPSGTVRALATSPIASLRGATAWSLGRTPGTNELKLLLPLCGDGDLAVRRRALEAVLGQFARFDPNTVVGLLQGSLASPDERIRNAAICLAEHLPENSWRLLWPIRGRGAPQVQLTLGLAAIQRGAPGQNHPDVAEMALAIFGANSMVDLRIQALRLIQLSFGDWNLAAPSAEVYAGYELSNARSMNSQLAARVVESIRAVFPSQNPVLDLELSRMLAMLGDQDINVFIHLFNRITPATSATDDFHYLTVLSRHNAPRDPSLFNTLQTPARIIANALLDLDRKLGAQQQRIKQNWNLRLAEITGDLIKRDPLFIGELLGNPAFVRPSHIPLAMSLPGEFRSQAAEAFYNRARGNNAFAWSPALISLLAQLPADRVAPLFRAHWNDPGLRDDLVSWFAGLPSAIDRDKFLWGLESPQSQIVQASLAALLALPRDDSAKNLAPVIKCLHRLCLRTNEVTARAQALSLISRQSGRGFSIQEGERDASNLMASYQPVFKWFAEKYPALAGTISVAENEPGRWLQKLRAVSWQRGNPSAGAVIFQSRCQSCHTVENAMGPDLNGVTRRYSPADLFLEIALPSRDIPPAYQPTVFTLRNKQTISGIVAFESADGFIIRTAANTTVRLATEDIVSRAPGDSSLMPEGLLDGLAPEAWADLHAYLKTLQAR